jgi:hypothetical protein
LAIFLPNGFFGEKKSSRPFNRFDTPENRPPNIKKLFSTFFWYQFVGKDNGLSTDKPSSKELGD